MAGQMDRWTDGWLDERRETQTRKTQKYTTPTVLCVPLMSLLHIKENFALASTNIRYEHFATNKVNL